MWPKRKALYTSKQGPILAPGVTSTRHINLDAEITAIEAAIPANTIDIPAGAGCDTAIQTAIGGALAGGGTIRIVPNAGDYIALFDSEVSIHGKIKITAVDGIIIRPSAAFIYTNILFDNANRGGVWATPGTAPFGTELDPNQPQTPPNGWYYDSDIILENLVVECQRAAARVARFICVNRLIYKNCTFKESGEAIIADQGVHNRFIIDCVIEDSGRGGSTLTPYLGNVGSNKPPRVQENAHWLYNTFTRCGDDAIGNIMGGRIEEEGADSDCWFDCIYWPNGYWPFNVIVGNTISGITQGTGIKNSFVPGMAADTIIEANTISEIASSSISLRSYSSLNTGACLPYPHVPDSTLRVDIRNNEFSSWGQQWNNGISYWIDNGLSYELFVAQTCASERALARDAGFYSSIFVREPYSLAGEIAITNNVFNAQVGPALYNFWGSAMLDDNTYNNFVNSPQSCGSPTPGTITEITDILVSNKYLRDLVDKNWALTYTYTH